MLETINSIHCINMDMTSLVNQNDEMAANDEWNMYHLAAPHVSGLERYVYSGPLGFDQRRD